MMPLRNLGNHQYPRRHQRWFQRTTHAGRRFAATGVRFGSRTGASERVAPIGFDLSERGHGLVGRSVGGIGLKHSNPQENFPSLAA